MNENGNNFLLSLILLASGKTIEFAHDALPVLAHYQFPPIIMQTMMIVAYCGTGMAGTIAMLNYFEIKWNPFKKSKNKRK